MTGATETGRMRLTRVDASHCEHRQATHPGLGNTFAHRDASRGCTRILHCPSVNVYGTLAVINFDLESSRL